jgi:hypothetical protein
MLPVVKNMKSNSDNLLTSSHILKRKGIFIPELTMGLVLPNDKSLLAGLSEGEIGICSKQQYNPCLLTYDFIRE